MRVDGATPDADEPIVDVDVVDETGAVTPTTAALATRPVESRLVRPVADMDEALSAFRQYQAFRDRLLTADDYKQAGARTFVTKSGWRKLATVMGVSVTLVSRNYEHDDRGRIIRAEVVVRAVAPNGRAMDGLGLCDHNERCCARAWGGTCRINARSHFHCEDGCDGTIHFSKPQHDIPATAYTRAVNRACADLFGFGEVSAEEMVDPAEPAASDADRDRIVAAMNAIADPDERRLTKRRFVTEFGYPDQLRGAQVPAALDWLTKVVGSPQAPDGPATRPAGEAAAETVAASPDVPTGTADPSGPSPVTDGANSPRLSSTEVTGGTSAGPPALTLETRAGGPLAPPLADNGQKRRIAILVNRLERTCRHCGAVRGTRKDDPIVHVDGCQYGDMLDGVLHAGDKQIITRILTAGRTDTTSELTVQEAVAYIQLLRHLEAFHVTMEEDAGERVLRAQNATGDVLLGELAVMTGSAG